jgi:aminoglycoside phosphotransferase (APT) family kinase protein
VVDRQALFSGTQIPPEHLQLDRGALADYLNDRIDGLGRQFDVSKFKGGQSNPTYKLTGEHRSFVLRRRPPGKLQPSAHAIDREYRVISALHAIGFPVPEPQIYCDIESVIGSTFYIVEYLEGRVFWNAELPGVAPEERGLIYDAMNEALAKLHALDYGALGLADFGPTGNYAARNLARWTKIYRASELVHIPDMDWLIEVLPARLPSAQRTTLLHGDYGLYNIIVHPTEPRLLAVLDWEMSTLGDPLIDLAHHLRAWWDVPDLERGSATSLVGLDLACLGIPPLEDYVARYCARLGLRDFPDRTFYLAYAAFRYAAMIQGILKRAAEGSNANRTVLQTQGRVNEIAHLARSMLAGG